MAAKQESSQFRITVWPGAPVPVPPIQRRPARPISNGDYLLYDEKRFLKLIATREEFVELPDELYLRDLIDLDERDPNALAAWSGEWGALTGFGKSAYELLGPAQDHPLVIEAQEEAQEYAARERLQSVHVVPTAAATAHVRTLKALTRHWIAHSDNPRDFKSIVAAWDGRYDTIEAAWRSFEELLNRALRPFQVRAIVGVGDNPFGVRAFGVQYVNSYSAMALQLANHIAEAATHRRCANATCGRLFVRQHGGAIYADQRHSTGVRYCTPLCARAQAQREYRRRKQQEIHR